MAITTVFSIPALLPLFDLLFNQKEIEPAAKPTTFALGEAESYLQYYMYKIFGGISPQQGIIYAIIFILAIFFIKNLFQYFVKITNSYLQYATSMDLRNDMMTKLLSLPATALLHDRKGDIITRYTSDVTTVEQGFFKVLETIFKSPLIIIGCLFYMIFTSPSLTLFVFGLLLFTVVVIGGLSRTLKKQSTAAQNQLGHLISILEESITGMKTIKSYYAQNHIMNLFRKSNRSFFGMANKIMLRRDLAGPMSEFMGILVVAMLLWFGSTLVFSNQMAATTFMTFIFAFYTIIDPAKKLSTALYSIQESLGAFSRIDDFLTREPSVTIREGFLPKKAIKDKIEIKNLYFRYPDGDRDVLKDINLVIPKGSTVALVGESGSGKSTLADLLCRFQVPSFGEITVDGTDLLDIEEKDLRSLISFVQQESILFNDTVRNNILFGKEEDSERLEEALRSAYALDFVNELEQGLDTPIGDRGNRLSGGQKQRLSISRAMYHDAPLLILDEATSALDSHAEEQIQMAINRFTENRTSIVIAHRLTTIQNADLICLLDEGEIVERGTHRELLELNGKYAKFVALQTFE